MAFIYLGLGTNLGDKVQNLNTAIQKIGIEIGDVWNVSAFYASKAWGYSSENNFLNAVILVSSQLTPPEVLTKTKQIEKKMGRTEKPDNKYHDRIIDIDIMMYDNLTISLPNLQIPHPWMHQRDFVLNPLEEIAPEMVHPVLNETIASLNSKLKKEKEKTQ